MESDVLKVNCMHIGISKENILYVIHIQNDKNLFIFNLIKILRREWRWRKYNK